MNRRWSVAFLLFAACASKSAPSSTMPTGGGGATATAGGGGALPGEVTCEQSVQQMMSILTTNKPDAPPDAVKHFHELFVQHCRSDAWSAQSRGCFAGMKSLDDGDVCAKNLTDAQRNALDAATSDDQPAAQPSGMVGGSAPGAAPGSGSATRGAAQRSGGDPEEGGK